MKRYPLGRRRVAIGLSGVLVMAGCSVTGLDSASDRFHCDAPKGVPCSSTSGVYANSVAGTLPRLPSSAQGGQFAATSANAESAAPPELPGMVTARRVVPGAGQAIRSLPRQLRVLVFPWVDADNDLHDQSYLYMAVDPGRWLIDHTRAGIRNDAPVPRLAQDNAAPEASRQEGDGAPARSNTIAPLPRLPAGVGNLRIAPSPGGPRPGLTESPVHARDVDAPRATRPTPDEED